MSTNKKTNRTTLPSTRQNPNPTSTRSPFNTPNVSPRNSPPPTPMDPPRGSSGTSTTSTFSFIDIIKITCETDKAAIDFDRHCHNCIDGLHILSTDIIKKICSNRSVYTAIESVRLMNLYYYIKLNDINTAEEMKNFQLKYLIDRELKGKYKKKEEKNPPPRKEKVNDNIAPEFSEFIKEMMKSNIEREENFKQVLNAVQNSIPNKTSITPKTNNHSDFIYCTDSRDIEPGNIDSKGFMHNVKLKLQSKIDFIPWYDSFQIQCDAYNLKFKTCDEIKNFSHVNYDNNISAHLYKTTEVKQKIGQLLLNKFNEEHFINSNFTEATNALKIVKNGFAFVNAIHHSP